jgi:predicted NBD/HSP70 family sugar kinase
MKHRNPPADAPERMQMRDVSTMRATVRDLRRASRAAVLRPLLFDGPQNRGGLARHTGLSSASMSNVVGELLEEGLLLEAGREESNGGRPRVLLRVNPDFGVVVGVDVGETGVRVEAFDLTMREVGGAHLEIHPQAIAPELLVDETAAAVGTLAAELEDAGRRILGVGVGVPGVVEHDAAAHVHAPSIGWDAVPLGALFQARIPRPLFVENGAKTLGQAEMWLGAGRGLRDVAVTLWATGVGAAIFTDGALFRGAASSAGEWGHTNAVPGGERCRCGASGCLESVIGAERLLRAWAEADPAVVLPEELDQPLWIDRLAAAATAGDGTAARVLDDAATAFGTAAADLVNLFNPERIVVAGWAGLALGPLLLERIRAVVAAQALPYAAARVSVELGALGVDAVALGASTLVLDALLAAGGHAPVI